MRGTRDPFRVTAPQFRPAFTPARQQARRAGAGCRRLFALEVAPPGRWPIAPHRPPIATDASGCRAYLVCRAGFAGRDTPLAQAIERYNSLSGPDPRCISGRPLSWAYGQGYATWFAASICARTLAPSASRFGRDRHV